MRNKGTELLIPITEYHMKKAAIFVMYSFLDDWSITYIKEGNKEFKKRVDALCEELWRIQRETPKKSKKLKKGKSR